MKKRNYILTTALMAFLAFGVIGCSDDDSNPMSPPMGDGASVRVVHASPDAPAVDVYAEGVSAPLISSLGYGDASAYLDLDPGTYNIQLRAAGSDPSSMPAFETGGLTIPDGAKITAVAVGLLGSASGSDDAFRVLPLVEGFADPGAGNAAVRIIHGSADAPAVALDVGNDGSPEIDDFARFADSGAEGVALTADTALQIGVWAGSPLSRVTAFTTPALPAGGEIFVIATGLLGDLAREETGFSLLAVGPSGAIGFIRQNPTVYALHASPDAPAVDIYAGSAKLAGDLDFGMISAAIQVPPGSYELDFAASGSMTVAASATTPALAAGERYLAVASGFLGDMSFTLLPYAEGFSGDGEASVRVVHASPDAPAVDVGTYDGKNFSSIGGLEGVVFGQASDAAGLEVPASALTLGVAAAGQADPVATFDLTPPSGLRAFAVAAGSLAGNGESFRLLLVDTSASPWTAASVLPN